jgi:hypothetical protein
VSEEIIYQKYKGYYVVYVSHPAMPNPTYNLRRRKRHFAVELKGKSLCNMLVQMGIEKIPWDSPWERIRKPKAGAHEICAICYSKVKLRGLNP